METLSEALARLAAAGYPAQLRAEPDGLHVVGTQCTHAPEAFVIEEIVRFEGASDPGDEAAAFALRCERHGTKGTYVVTYGLYVDPLDAEMVRRLGEGRAR